MSAPEAGGSTYPPSHPWYYLLGHPVLPPRAILFEARREGYRGYRGGEIDRAARLCEPERTRALNDLRAGIMAELRRDLARYREGACALGRYRAAHAQPPPVCASVHTDLSLKYCHLLNDFAHLAAIDTLPQQQDLFA